MLGEDGRIIGDGGRYVLHAVVSAALSPADVSNSVMTSCCYMTAANSDAEPGSRGRDRREGTEPPQGDSVTDDCSDLCGHEPRKICVGLQLSRHIAK